MSIMNKSMISVIFLSSLVGVTSGVCSYEVDVTDETKGYCPKWEDVEKASDPKAGHKVFYQKNRYQIELNFSADFDINSEIADKLNQSIKMMKEDGSSVTITVTEEKGEGWVECKYDIRHPNPRIRLPLGWVTMAGGDK
ncbi:MAG: hypothetical protein ABFQ95_04465 [Pseudomonadota bacterium]